MAVMLYVAGALCYYLPFLLGPGASTALAVQLFFLLPPVCAGAAAYEVSRRLRQSEFVPRRLAVAALGSGAAARVAWELFLFALFQHNRRSPPPDLSGPDLGTEFMLAVVYGVLCVILSIGAGLALPRLVRRIIRDVRG